MRDASIVQLWDDGQYLLAGKQFVSRFRRDDVPAWLASILEILVKAHPDFPEVTRLVDVARDPQRWLEARNCFDDLRRRRLSRCDKDWAEAYVALAETCAKTVFNASDGEPKFDEHASWRIPLHLKAVVDALPDADVELGNMMFVVLWQGPSSTTAAKKPRGERS